MVFHEQLLPLFTGRAKEFFFGLFHESKEMREEYDTGGIRVRPIRLKS